MLMTLLWLNFLKLNEDKTEVLIISPESAQKTAAVSGTIILWSKTVL